MRRLQLSVIRHKVRPWISSTRITAVSHSVSGTRRGQSITLANRVASPTSQESRHAAPYVVERKFSTESRSRRRNSRQKASIRELRRSASAYLPTQLISHFFPRADASPPSVAPPEEPCDTAASPTPPPQAPPSVSTDEMVRCCYMNPFSRKIVGAAEAHRRSLLNIGFRQQPTNPLRLEWHPPTYEKALRLHSRRVTGSYRKEAKVDGQAARREAALSHIVKQWEGSPVKWRREVGELLRRADRHTAIPADIAQRYADLMASNIPQRFIIPPDQTAQDIVLTPDQEQVLRLAHQGHNLFIGGSAGTGKTMLLKVLHRTLTDRGLRVAMTATTGVAAVQLGGWTFHHSFRVPIEDDTSSPRAHQAWDGNALRAFDVVVIDEVSLLGAQHFDSFDVEARLARMYQQVFGGLQVIVCGDFMQLTSPREVISAPLYESQAFKYLVQLQLVTPMRFQVDDPLPHLLAKLRRGEFDAEAFHSLDRPVPEDATDATYIFPCRRDAQAHNEMKLNELQAQQVVCAPRCSPLQLVGHFTSSALIEAADPMSGLPCRGEVVATLLHLVRTTCPDATWVADHDCVVMPAKRSRSGLLVRLRLPEKSTLKSTTDGHGVHTLCPTPSTRLAFPVASREAGAGTRLRSISTHSWEAITALLAAKVNGRIAGWFDHEPQALIPLSVSMGLADMSSSGTAEMLQPLRLKVGCRVMVTRNLSRNVSNGSVGVVESFAPPDEQLLPSRKEGASSTLYKRVLSLGLYDTLPVVRLLEGGWVQIPPVAMMLGGTPQSFYYGHEVYTLPLQLGYGFTVHKVQGLTLQGLVVLDCRRFFNCPHLIYVACSRVRNLDQLIVRNVKADMVIINTRALSFSNGLADASHKYQSSPTVPRASWATAMNDDAEMH